MRKNILLLLFLGAVLTLTGCTSVSEPYYNPGTQPVTQYEDPEAQLITQYEDPGTQPPPPCEIIDMQPLVRLEDMAALISTGGEHDPAATAVARGANDFAFRLGATLLEGVGHDNFVVSPFSVWMPLAALVNATQQPLRPALIETLGAGGSSTEDINRAASRMLFDLTNDRPRRESLGQWHGSEESALHIANAIFVDYNWPLRREFAQTFADFYRGSSMNLDFETPEAVDAVNQWASDNTNGLIDEVIREFDPDAIAAVANAIYFSGAWLDEFDPDNTERGTFYSPAGEREVYFMRQHRLFTYFEDEQVQAVNLGFVCGSGMKIILPKDGDAVGLLSSMTGGCFERMRNDSVLGEGMLKLPRFSIENTIDNLANALIAMGVPLFDKGARPLTGGLVYDDGYPVWLGGAVQVAMIEADEEGATAAAVTVMEVFGILSVPNPEATFVMICDTPFAFILHSGTRDGGRQVLFMGVVNQP